MCSTNLRLGSYISLRLVRFTIFKIDAVNISAWFARMRGLSGMFMTRSFWRQKKTPAWIPGSC